MVAGPGVPRGTVFAYMPVGHYVPGHPTGPAPILHVRSTADIGSDQPVPVIGP